VLLKDAGESLDGLYLTGLGEQTAKGVAQDKFGAAAHGQFLRLRSAALGVAHDTAQMRHQHVDIVLDPPGTQLGKELGVSDGEPDANIQNTGNNQKKNISINKTQMGCLLAGLDKRLRKHAEEVVGREPIGPLDLDTLGQALALGGALDRARVCAIVLVVGRLGLIDEEQ